MCVPVTEGTGSARTAPYFLGPGIVIVTCKSSGQLLNDPPLVQFVWPSHLHFRILRIVNLSHTNFGVSVGPYSSMVTSENFAFRSQDLEVDLAADLPEVGNCGGVKRQHSY